MLDARSVIYNGLAPVECVRRRRGDNRSLANWSYRPDRAGKRPVGIRSGGAHCCFGSAAGRANSWCADDALFSNPEYSRRVRAEAEGLPIEFTGWRDDIRDVLSSLDLVVVPSARSGGHHACDPGSIFSRYPGGGFSIRRDTGDCRGRRYWSAVGAHGPGSGVEAFGAFLQWRTRCWMLSPCAREPLLRRAFPSTVTARKCWIQWGAPCDAVPPHSRPCASGLRCAAFHDSVF